MPTSPAHDDVLTMTLDPAEGSAMTECLRVFNPEETCAVWHGYTEGKAWQVIALVALGTSPDGSITVSLTREQVAVLHCVVASADVCWSNHYQQMEANLYRLKLSDGYIPGYLDKPASPPVEVPLPDELVMPHEDLIAS